MIDAACQTPFYDYPLCHALVDVGCDLDLVTAPFLYGGLPPAPSVPVRLMFGRVAPWGPLRGRQRLRQVARGLEYPFDWASVLAHIRARRPDVVHVQWAMVPIVDGMAFRAIRRAGVRLIYTVHDIYPHYGQLRRWLLSTRPLLHLADDLIVHTEANKAQLCEIAGLPPEKVHHIAQGNVVDWSGPRVPRDAARRRLGLLADAPLILFFGVIKPYKRLEMLLEALSSVLASLPETRLLVAGRPEGGFDRYQQVVDRLGLGDRVVTHLGYIPESAVPDYFAAANVLALPYTDADFSGVLLHAASFGLPAVATETGGLHQVIADGETGFVVPSDGTRALADALLRVLGDRELGDRMGERSRERALAEHDWHASARKTVRLYQGRPDGAAAGSLA